MPRWKCASTAPGRTSLPDAVYHLVRAGGGEPLPYRGDAAVLDPYIRPHRAPAREDRQPAEHHRYLQSSGADEYLEAPYSPMRLIALVARLVERKQSEDNLLRQDQVFRMIGDGVVIIRSGRSHHRPEPGSRVHLRLLKRRGWGPFACGLSPVLM